MEHIWKIPVAIIVGFIGYLWWKHKRYREKADKFKETLIHDLPNYIAEETTIGVVVTGFFPKHNDEFQRLLVYVPKRKHKRFVDAWSKYKEVYDLYKSSGILSVIGAELPHPDFEPSLENVRAIERKRKTQVSKAINEFLEEL